MKKVTKRQIADWKAAGADYSRDWLSWNKENPNALDEFNGQSEAVDMADCSDPDQKEIAADYIYEGMLAEIKRIRAHQCSVCHKPLSENDRAQYEAEGGEGYPDCHDDCAALEAADEKLRSYARG